MSDVPVRHAPIMNIEKPENQYGPLPYENLLSVLTNIYWVGKLAAALEIVAASDDLEHSHEVARDHLGMLIDPVDGLRAGIPEELRLRWRIASAKSQKGTQ